MLGTLLPEDVVTEWSDPRLPAAPLFPEEERLVERAVPKRRNEFAKARECARLALARLGVRDFPLLSGPDREPLWPAGIVGSLTHTDGFCGVAVAHSARYVGIGIDAEPAQPLREELVERICTPRERSALVELRWMHWLEAARLVFSIKEAVYKCQFPSSRQFLGFHDVELELSESGSFLATLLVPAPPFAERAPFAGTWARREGLLLAATWLERRTL
jgi:4'-phosphopantetheinyl transferase EntD